MEPSALVYDTAAAAEVWRGVLSPAAAGAGHGDGTGTAHHRRRTAVRRLPPVRGAVAAEHAEQSALSGAGAAAGGALPAGGVLSAHGTVAAAASAAAGRTGDAAPVPAAGVHRRGGVPAGLRRAVPAAGGRLSAPAADGGGAAVGDPGKKAGGFAGKHLDNGE